MLRLGAVVVAEDIGRRRAVTIDAQHFAKLHTNFAFAAFSPTATYSFPSGPKVHRTAVMVC